MTSSMKRVHAGGYVVLLLIRAETAMAVLHD